MLLRPGEVLEGRLETYTIAATISRGAYGCAFRARASDGSWRVVKQFEPSEELAADDHAYQRRCFEREAEILTRFDSPAIVRGCELIARGRELFLVMEHIQGQTLRALLDERRLNRAEPFDLPTILAVAEQLCAVVDWLHALPGQLIFRDLKPSNIMWDAVARRIKLIDFGAARFCADEPGATQGLGTEGYAPPELYGSRALTPATDIYTVGAVLYELASGTPPAGRQTPTDFRGRDDALPAGFRAAVLRALAQDPAERFPDGASLLAALTAVAPRPDPLGLRATPRNHHPLLACYCPVCGAEPSSDTAIYCGRDGRMFQVALLSVVPKHRPATTLYLDRPQLTIGRNDPDRGHYPELDLTASDAGRHVSRRHAILTRQGLAYTLEVLPTTNPTRLDGRRIEPPAILPLAPGARLELGDLVATLVLKPVLDAPAGSPA